MGDRVVFDEAALTELFESPEGPSGKYLKRKGLQVQRRAKQFAPVDTGRLRASITEELARDDGGLVERIGSDVSYAAFQEFGTSKMAARPYLRPALDAVQGIT